MTSNILAIERDIHARRHTKEPFDQRYLDIISGPMNNQDGDSTNNNPQHISNIAREVKMRTSLIQAQVNTLQRSVNQAFSKNRTAKLVDEDQRLDETTNNDDLKEAGRQELVKQKLITMQGLQSNNIEVIKCLIASIKVTIPRETDASVFQKECPLETVFPNNKSIHNFKFSDSEISKPSDAEDQFPPQFFSKYLKKIKPFCFSESLTEVDSSCSMMQDFESESNSEDATSSTAKQIPSKENEHSFRHTMNNINLHDASSETMEWCQEEQKESQQQREHDIDQNDYRNEIEQQIYQESQSQHHTAGGRKDMSSVQFIQQPTPTTMVVTRSDQNVNNEMRNNFDQNDNQTRQGAYLSIEEFDDEDKPEENKKPKLDSCQSNRSNNKKQLGSSDLNNNPFKKHRHSPEDIGREIQTCLFPSGEDDGITPNSMKFNEKSCEQKSKSFGNSFNTNLSSSSLDVDNTENTGNKVSVKKSKKKVKSSEVSSSLKWGSFTPSDATRYFNNLQIGCNSVQAQSSSSKKRFKLKSHASLLVPGAPASDLEAFELLCKDQRQRSSKYWRNACNNIGKNKDPLIYALSRLKNVNILEHNDYNIELKQNSLLSKLSTCIARSDNLRNENQNQEFMDITEDSESAAGHVDEMLFDQGKENESFCEDNDCGNSDDTSPEIQFSLPSVIRTSFSDAIVPQGNVFGVENKKVSVGNMAMVSMAFIRRALLKFKVVPPISSTITLDKVLLDEISRSKTSCPRRGFIDTRLVFTSALTLAHQFNRPNLSSDEPNEKLSVNWIKLATGGDNSKSGENHRKSECCVTPTISFEFIAKRSL